MVEELKEKLRQAQETTTRLREGTDSVRLAVYDTRWERFYVFLEDNLTTITAYGTKQNYVCAGRKICTIKPGTFHLQ